MAHRDYTISVIDIELSIYADRLEVISPGRLPNTVTVDKMRAGYRASRNELIKEVLRDYRYRGGHGAWRAAEDCRRSCAPTTAAIPTLSRTRVGSSSNCGRIRNTIDSHLAQTNQAHGHHQPRTRRQGAGLLKAGLGPSSSASSRSVYKDGPPPRRARFLGDDRLNAKRPMAEWDAAALLKFMWETWNDVFRRTLGPAERSLVSELRDHRNKWAHQQTFSSDDAYRALDSAGRLLTAVSAPQADEIEKMKMELLRLRFDEQVRSEKRKTRRHGHRERGGRPPQALARGGDAAPGRRQRPLPAGRVRGRSLAGASGRGHRRVQGSGRVLPPHLPDREPEGHARRSGSALWRARAATRSSSSRRTSAAARRTRCWRSTTSSPASRPATCRVSTR